VADVAIATLRDGANGAGFAGFGQAGLDFLAGLSRDNTKAFFDAKPDRLPARVAGARQGVHHRARRGAATPRRSRPGRKAARLWPTADPVRRLDTDIGKS
jgi:hypothetical protein